MNGYTPVFASIYDGTLYGRWPAAAVFASLLPLADRHGEIDLSLQAIAGRTGWPVDLLDDGIRQLMEPDSGSRSPIEQGRRLLLLDPARPWGWKLVNHSVYREKARKAAFDAARSADGRNAARMQERRVRATRDDPRVPGDTREHPPSDSDSNTNPSKTYTSASPPGREVGRQRKASTGEPPEFAEFRAAYPSRLGSQEWSRALVAAHARLREGHTWAELVDGARRYAAFCRSTETAGTKFVKQAATFLGTGRSFLEPWASKPITTVAERPDAPATLPDGRENPIYALPSGKAIRQFVVGPNGQISHNSECFE